MNKAIMDGLILRPPPFESGLDVWSCGDGTPGTRTYDKLETAAFVPADEDFGGCLEVEKTENVQALQYTGETPLFAGCYLQVKAWVKAISGPLPTVRIVAFVGGAKGNPVMGIQTAGPSTKLMRHGDIVEIAVIVGSGSPAACGADLCWKSAALFGHFGIELTGGNGGVVRIDDLDITDVTNTFLGVPQNPRR